MKEIGENVTGVQGDVSKLSDLDHLFSRIEREKGRLDIVFAGDSQIRMFSVNVVSKRRPSGTPEAEVSERQVRPRFELPSRAASLARKRVNRSEE